MAAAGGALRWEGISWIPCAFPIIVGQRSHQLAPRLRITRRLKDYC
jgi:hypothetical protein